MRSTELLERLTLMPCSGTRRPIVEHMIKQGQIISPDILRFAATASDKAFDGFATALGVDSSVVMLSMRDGKGGSQPTAEDDDPSDEDLKRMAMHAGCFVAELKKAIKAKREAERDDGEISDEARASLKRNGLGDDYRPNAPGPLSGDNANQCRGSRELRASIAVDDGDGEADKQGRLLRLHAEMTKGK